MLDQTVFYATAGGQPGDKGRITWDGGAADIATTVYDDVKNVVHVPVSPGALPPVGATVTASLDWDNRYRTMRAHTLMHLLCASVPFPVTGGAIGEDGGRIDFDIPEGQIPDKADLSTRINRLVEEDHAVSCRWITDEEMAANQHLIRTMSVKPPMGTGRVRLVMIGEDGKVDLQPCQLLDDARNTVDRLHDLVGGDFSLDQVNHPRLQHLCDAQLIDEFNFDVDVL